MASLETAHAFPDEIVANNLEVIESLAASAFLSTLLSPIPVQFEGATLIVPRRGYYSVELVDAAIGGSDDGAIVAACLGARSHDGYLRQLSIEALLREPRPWSVPYLVEAVGEYVVEILQVLEGRLPGEFGSHFAAYLIANEDHFSRLCRQCVSYWNEFDRYRYEGLYPDWNTYPGARIIADLTATAQSLEPSFGSGLENVLPNRRALRSRRD